MIDISITSTKIRAARYASSFEPDIGAAGVEKTRKEPVLLTDKQHQLIERFSASIPKEQHASFSNAVCSRLSGAPGTAAVAASIYAALVEYGLPTAEARALLGVQNKPRVGGGKEAMGPPIA